MGSEVQCHWLEPLNTAKRSLKRYDPGSSCSVSATGYHHALVPIDIIPITRNEHGSVMANLEWPTDDPRWPKKCVCGFEFTDNYQFLDIDPLYKRDTGEEISLREAAPGDMHNAVWLANHWSGPDGMCLVVKLPNGNDWMIDSQCKNCTIPEDHFQKNHHCWIRHGTPPNITVNKDGITCGAGGGSIQAGNYHGMLTNGILREC